MLQEWGCVPEDAAMAFKYFKMSAEQGFSDAQSTLGFCYQSGQGVERDPALAYHWFKLACDQGKTDAQVCPLPSYPRNPSPSSIRALCRLGFYTKGKELKKL